MGNPLHKVKIRKIIKELSPYQLKTCFIGDHKISYLTEMLQEDHFIVRESDKYDDIYIIVGPPKFKWASIYKCHTEPYKQQFSITIDDEVFE
mgnify:CR=1 FL=1